MNPANKALMKQLVINGPDAHPGANFVEQKDSKYKKFLRYGNRFKIAQELKVLVLNYVLYSTYIFPQSPQTMLVLCNARLGN